MELNANYIPVAQVIRPSRLPELRMHQVIMETFIRLLKQDAELRKRYTAVLERIGSSSEYQTRLIGTLPADSHYRKDLERLKAEVAGQVAPQTFAFYGHFQGVMLPDLERELRAGAGDRPQYLGEMAARAKSKIEGKLWTFIRWAELMAPSQAQARKQALSGP